MELKKLQKLRQNTSAWLGQLEVAFGGTGFSVAKRKPNKLHKIAYQIDQAVEAFNKVSNNRNVVLVHCAMGRSRSATCVIMYIMKKFGVSYDDVTIITLIIFNRLSIL